MRKRPIAILLSLFLSAMVLVACGDEDTDPTPTAVPATAEATLAPTEEQVIEPLATATEEAVATEEDAQAATPTAEATPVEIATIASEYAATPESAESALPVPTEQVLVPMSGALLFEGRAQQDYVISEAGCTGLGEWRSLKAGAQVIVRDGAGNVVDVTTLEDMSNDDSCEWVFEAEVPADGFFSVTIPMVTEVWFHAEDDEVQAGQIELVVP